MDLSVVVQDGREPALADLELHALALRVGLDLVLLDLADGEVRRARVGEDQRGLGLRHVDKQTFS